MSFDINKPYTTRDGRAAWFAVDPNGTLVGWVDAGKTPGGREMKTPHFWWPDGKYDKLKENAIDLVNIPERRTVKVWINVYPDAEDWCAYESRTFADKFASGSRIACIEREISYEVGEGL